MELLAETPAARYLDVSPLTMKDWRKRRRGPAFVRIGRNVRYLRCDLDAYVEARRVDPKPARQQTTSPPRSPVPRPPRRPSPTAGRRPSDPPDTEASAKCPPEARPS